MVKIVHVQVQFRLQYCSDFMHIVKPYFMIWELSSAFKVPINPKIIFGMNKSLYNSDVPSKLYFLICTRKQLRDYLSSVKLPCIPYLGKNIYMYNVSCLCLIIIVWIFIPTCNCTSLVGFSSIVVEIGRPLACILTRCCMYTYIHTYFYSMSPRGFSVKYVTNNNKVVYLMCKLCRACEELNFGGKFWAQNKCSMFNCELS